jgi:hypothetical protein
VFISVVQCRFSPASLGSNSSLKAAAAGQAGRSGGSARARNRFKIPSSAVSMPSLTLDETAEEEGSSGQLGQGSAAAGAGGQHSGPDRTPGLEKSASSASIIRARGGQVARLGRMIFQHIGIKFSSRLTGTFLL